MKLYSRVWYPEKKIEVLNKTIIDILTLNERSSIEWGYYDSWFEREQTMPFAINYAWKIGDCSPILRGFQFEDILYEINSDDKTILIQPIRSNLFYDHDKIEKNNFVFEGGLDEFVKEFIKTGYRIKKK